MVSSLASTTKFVKTDVLPLSVEPCITQQKKAIIFTIKTMTGKKFDISADPADPITLLKRQIQEKENMTIQLQRLMYNGRVLENKKTVGFYNINAGSMIHLLKRNMREDEEDEEEEEDDENNDEGDDQIPVQILYKEEPVFTIKVSKKDTIADVRAKIMPNIEVDTLRIMQDGKRILDNQTVMEINLFDKPVLQINGNIQVKVAPDFKVNVFCQQVSYPVNVSSTMSVKELRSSVSGMVMYPFILLSNGKILSDNDANLGSCGITKPEDIIVIPESTGGNCLKLMLTIEGVDTHGVEQLRDSLKFLEDQQALDEIFTEGLETIKTMKNYSRYKPEELLAVRLWTSNILYKQLNVSLASNKDLGRWSIYLKNLMTGLKHMEYYKGKAYRGIQGSQNFEDYKTGAKVSWKSISGLTRDKAQATEAAGKNGAIFEIEVVSARDISKLSLSPSEKLMLLPYSCFEVMDVVSNSGQQLLVKLREIPIPRATKVLFWVDDEPDNNYYVAKPLEEKGISVVFCTSTKDALDVIESYKWLLSLGDQNFRVVSDMVRYENGKPNYTAGIDLLKALFNVYQYKFPVMIFCNNVELAQENAKKADLQGKYQITNQDDDLEKFIHF